MSLEETKANLGCSHYKRKCKLMAPCCQKTYNCRFCHDESEENHTMDRKAVEQVECLGCCLLQPLASQCKDEVCGLVFGSAYFCLICKLFDDTQKGQFHCDGCGICRAGGRDSFEHCDTCGLCLPINKPHKCISGSSKTNCPVCMEDIHTSRVGAHVPPCSHLLHNTCYVQMVSNGLYACPTCGLSMQDMSRVWKDIDRDVAETPMPREYQGLFRNILCRDCNTSSMAPFHVVGMKCVPCGSYNTTLDKGPLLKQEEEGDFRPLSEAEEAQLTSASFPVPENVSDISENGDEEGWETTEEDDNPEEASEAERLEDDPNRPGGGLIEEDLN